MQPDLHFYGIILVGLLFWGGSELINFLARSSNH